MRVTNTSTCLAVANTNDVRMDASAFGTSAEVNNKMWLAECTGLGHGLLQTCAGNPALHFSSCLCITCKSLP